MGRKTKKRKPRTPYGYRVRTERGTILERSLGLPKEWPYRERLVEFDALHGMAGAWVSAIERVFPSAWLREQVDGAHEIARTMSRGWPIATRNIAEVADAILAAEQATAGHDEIAKRLQVHEQYLGALFEARSARLVCDAGLEYAFATSRGADGAGADLHVATPQPFVLEVKHVKNALRAYVPQALTRLISPILPGALPLGTHVAFDWSGEDVLAISENTDADEQIRSIASRVGAELCATLDGIRLDGPREIGIVGAGVVRITPDTAMPNSISIATLLPTNLNDRRLASRVRRARLQVRPELTGVMVLCGDPDLICGDCTARLVADELHALGESMPQLSGAIVFLTTRSDEVLEATWPVPNPFARVRLDALPLDVAKTSLKRKRFRALADLFEWRP